MRLLIKLSFKKCLFNFKIKAAYIKVFGIFNGFKLKLKIKTKVFENRSGLIIKGLIKAFYKAVHLKRI